MRQVGKIRQAAKVNGKYRDRAWSLVDGREHNNETWGKDGSTKQGSRNCIGMFNGSENLKKKRFKNDIKM